MPRHDLPPPWHAFLRDLDERLDEPIALQCVGGFVVSLLYGLQRPTGDVDVVSVVPAHVKVLLVHLAGRGSDLHRRHGVFLRIVTVATLPEDYATRLTEMFPGTFTHLTLFAVDPYDLALSKIERNIDQDVEDVKHLARAVPFDLAELRRRYEQELRPNLGRPEREDLTLQLWIDAIAEERALGSRAG